MKQISAEYPMTSVNISRERGCWELHNFPTPSDLISHESWEKSKYPYQFRNHVIPNLATAQAPRTTRLAATWFLDPESCLIGNYAISRWVWVLAICLIELTRFAIPRWSLHLQRHKTTHLRNRNEEKHWRYLSHNTISWVMNTARVSIYIVTHVSSK